MTTNKNELLFQEDEDAPILTASISPDLAEPKWKILIVDDDEEVHTVTKMALRRFTFDRKAIKCISAYSAAEGQKTFIRKHGYSGYFAGCRHGRRRFRPQDGSLYSY